LIRELATRNGEIKVEIYLLAFVFDELIFEIRSYLSLVQKIVDLKINKNGKKGKNRKNEKKIFGLSF
jgi:uncharacterized membrane protein YebE (DUF533 family)